MFLTRVLCSKKKHMKKCLFLWQKTWTNPLQNFDFLDCVRTSLFRCKKHSFLSRISKNIPFWVSLLKKNIWEKGRFYDKNHGLTPLQNVYFLDFFKTSLLRSKEYSFISRISKNISFWLSLLKKNLLKTDRFFFKKTYGLTPLHNSNFLDFFRTSLFKYKKHSFLSRISKNVSFWLPLLKKNIRKRSIFWQNHGLTPLQNVHFLHF